jgi:glycosyltransferase involved in cell wall biosynthesis
MKLCIATSSYPSIGENSFAGVFIRDFARALVCRRIEVSIFSQDTGELPQIDHGIEVTTFPWPGKATPLSTLKPYLPLDIMNMFLILRRGSRQLVQHCKQKEVDFLLTVWTLPAGHWGIHVQKRLGIPFAVWSLGSDVWIYGRLPIFKLWVRRILKRAHVCFADGFSLAKEVRTLSGRPCSFLPTTRILPREGIPEIDFPPGKRHYLFIGRYHKNKGPDILLEAIRLLDHKALSGIQFHFFGTGFMESDLKRRVLEYHLENDVTIQGPVDEYRMVALLKKCHALIIPSRIESIPVVLSDALQVDCNMIVSNVGDMGSLVRSFHAGVVVDELSPEAFKEAILRQSEKKEDEFKEGRQKLYALFNLEKSVDTFLKSLGIGDEEGHF